MFLQSLSGIPINIQPLFDRQRMSYFNDPELEYFAEAEDRNVPICLDLSSEDEGQLVSLRDFEVESAGKDLGIRVAFDVVVDLPHCLARSLEQ